MNSDLLKLNYQNVHCIKKVQEIMFAPLYDFHMIMKITAAKTPTGRIIVISFSFAG